MTYKFLCCVLLCFVQAGYVFTQNDFVINGIVQDSTHSFPLEFANAYLKGKQIGTLSNGEGKFKIHVSSQNVGDTLVVSFVGYRTYFKKIEKNTNDLRISLSKTESELPLILIGRKPTQKLILGEKVKKSESGICNCVKKNYQVAIFFKDNQSRIGQLRTISMYLDEQGDLNYPFRLRIYEADSITGLPGKDILNKSLVLMPTQKKWFEINLDSLNIITPVNGFFVGYEWLYNDETIFYKKTFYNGKEVGCFGQCLGLITSNLDVLVVEKTEGTTWNRFNYLKDRKGKAYAPMIKVEADFLEKE